MTTRVKTDAGRLARHPLPAHLLRWECRLVVLIVVTSAINGILSPYFLETQNLFRASSDFMEIGLMMLPMVLIIVSGNLDLSVASNLGMCASFMGWLFNNGWNIWLAAGAALILGGLAGVLNGFLIARTKLPALVVTLGTFAFYRGMAFVLLGDQAARGYPGSFTYLGQGTLGDTPVPFSLVLFLAFALIYGLVLHKTTFGYSLYAIGNNEEACRYSGIAVDQAKTIAFGLSGVMSALAGIILASRFGSTRPDIATGMELDVITATVVGGINIFGGSGTMIGAVLSLCLIGIVRFGMGLMNVPGQVQSLAIGFLLILAILLPQLGRRLSSGSIRLSRKTVALVIVAAIVTAAFAGFFTWSRSLILTPAPMY
jgi:rhamnose transport system permease protein